MPHDKEPHCPHCLRPLQDLWALDGGLSPLLTTCGSCDGTIEIHRETYSRYQIFKPVAPFAANIWREDA